ncbi:MAG: Ni/Fe hydrogenase subunit alpha [Anaerolineales bacterium]|nr:Ni/Fe hydrogenase subunit alpha [Anaerolineales bacterium]MCX7609451.1 Ni/Fe hydrogenase subunit alpha [Anaerolineales bacterium]MDW8227693.1 Ni/Fe hydrogenase subunit alpha [Anaerolineales bacterium]
MMSKLIEVPALARVEGEGGLYIRFKNGQAEEIRLKIYEPPRFFEGFLQGRFLQEVPDITARICGICPVAYQMSSVQALEAALGVTISEQVRLLRRLMYCGEYIESHALHIYLLQAPDLLGKESVLELAAVAPDVVKNALRLKKIGNDLLKAIGGRSVHPVNACVGGFYRWPDVGPIRALLPDLEWGLEASLETVRWALTLPYPELELDYEFVALHRPDEYAIYDGEVWSSKRAPVPVEEFDRVYLEEHVPHSNALHGRTIDGNVYLVGPLARLNLNHEQLSPIAQKALREADLKLPLRNPYKSLIARAIELVEAYETAIELVKQYHPSGKSQAPLTLKTSVGAGASEAPRGLLFHRYAVNDQGMVLRARIVPPTAQNLPRIEADLAALVPQLVSMSNEEATLTAEHLVRSYDPCISCATHFLRVQIEEVK